MHRAIAFNKVQTAVGSPSRIMASGGLLVTLTALFAFPVWAGNPPERSLSLADAISDKLAAKIDFELPAQPLGSALKQLASQAGIEILFEQKIVDGLRAPAIEAHESVTQALETLLNQTDLEYTARDQAVAIRRKISTTAPRNSSYEPNSANEQQGGRAARNDTAPRGPEAKRASSADTSSTETRQAAAAGGALQEIVVTAQRRAEDISKVPISITAINQANIDKLGIKDFSDMAKYTPGVVIDTDRTQEISIRGIAASGGADTTGIYIDDTPVQTRSALDALPEAFDVDRIEVLRGPQGTLFGAGAEGGAVRYITAQPSVTSSSLYSRDEISYTQGGAPNYEVGVAGGGPLIDNVLGVRATALVTYQGGWIDRIDSESPTVNTAPSQTILDSNANRLTEKMFRLAALWKPNENWQITPALYYQNKNQNDETQYWPIYSNPGQNLYYNGTPDRFAAKDRFYLPSFNIQGDLGFAHFVSNTSYFHRNATSIYGIATGTTSSLSGYQNLIQPLLTSDASWAPGLPWVDGAGIHLPPGFRYYAPGPDYSRFDNWTQEFRLQSHDPGSKLQWTAGAFYQRNEEDHQNLIHADYDAALFATQDLTIADLFGPGASLLSNPTASYYALTKHNTRQYAGFADISYAFTDQWKLAVGLRESWIDYSFFQYTTGLQPPLSTSGENKQSSFTPRANLSFQVDPSDMVYFTYAKGFRPGGANAPIPAVAGCDQDFVNLGITGTPLSYDSDTTDSFEIGAKNNIANRVQLATAVYWINWNGIQQQAVLPTCQLAFISNLGQAVSKGLDFQATVLLTDSFTLNVAAGYTEARYTKSSKLAPSAPTPIVASGDAINGANGNPVPPWSGTVGFEYRFSAFTHEAFFRADDQYVSGPRWLGPQFNPNTTLYDPGNFPLPSVNQVNLRTGVTLGQWEINAFVNNLTDAHPITTYALSSLPVVPASRLKSVAGLRPRTLGLTFIFRK